MSLIEKARKIDRRRKIAVTSEEVDLAIEWAYDRLSGPQVLGALGKTTTGAQGSLYNFIATRLREAVRKGKLVTK